MIDEKFGSDHFLIAVDDLIPIRTPTIRRLSLPRADWKRFEQLAVLDEDSLDNVDEMLDAFEDSVNKAALETIPHTYGGIGRIPVPWWNEDCRTTRKEKKIAQRRYHRHPTIENKMHLNQTRANARRVQRRARKQCWIDYINRITTTTPINSIFKTIKKIQGKYKSGQYIKAASYI